MKPVPTAIALLTAGLLLGGSDLHALQELVIRNANVVDVTSGQIRTGTTVLVEDGRITSVTQGEVEAPTGARVVDLQGMYLAPGLIDAHVHLDGGDQATRALRFGVTTARSMGTSHYADVGIRELQSADHMTAPQLLAAGYHVRPPAAEAFFQDHPELGRFMEAGIRSPEALRAMVRALLSRDVDFVKTNATERAGLPDTDPRKQFYSEAQLRIIVETAAEGGVPVAAHAHGDAGALAAIRAGVRSIEHGTYMSEPTLREMVERGTFLAPTVAIVTDLTIPGGDYDVPHLQIRGRHMLPRLREMVATAHRLGVRIVAATDTGYGPGSTIRLGHELEEFVGVGMSPFEALRTATVNAAELMGLGARTGRIEAGLDADFIVTERNPLEDIRAVQDVLLVVSDGTVVEEKGDWFSPERPIG